MSKKNFISFSLRFSPTIFLFTFSILNFPMNLHYKKHVLTVNKSQKNPILSERFSRIAGTRYTETRRSVDRISFPAATFQGGAIHKVHKGGQSLKAARRRLYDVPAS